MTYAKPVKEFGEKGVLSGFEAAIFLISKYGFDAYLYGLSGYYMIAAASCFVLCLFGWKDGPKILGVKAALLSIFSAAIFYFFDFKIYVNSSLNGQRGFVSGYNAIHEVGGVWLLVNMFSLSLLFFATLLVNAFFCRLFVRIK
ncbi:hypothetical protein [Thiohalomonas denitrificans]|uniref:hypothetical protein n=1 Tax=Thiohalomonas denitrificans TaxID=415747 RepID=UPI0026E971E5|nr:hypothetical protein [Thiohalomonas denitrificans]